MVFGVPIMLNPVFFIPMVLTTPITGGLAWLMCSLGLGSGFNPTVSPPGSCRMSSPAFWKAGFSWLFW